MAMMSALFPDFRLREKNRNK